MAREDPTASILVVDDNPAFRGAIERSLTRKGCRVTTAADGDAGLRAVREQSFDVVIADLHAPKHGSLWLWQHAVKVRPELRGRFLLVSSEQLPRTQTMNLIVGSEHFLVRPSDPDALWHGVQEVLGRGDVTADASSSEEHVNP